VRLVWAIIPLVLISIIGIQESFEEDYSYNFGKMELYRGSDIDSPKVQFENGAERHEILCKDGLYLVYKTSDGSPACVEEYYSAPKLVDRGWATLGETSLVITTDKEVYSVGENVIITMKNDGETLLTFSGFPNFYIHDESENDVELPLDRIVPPTENLSYFDTFASTTFVWNQTTRDGEPAKTGIYTIFANYMEPLPSNDLAQLGNQWLETTKTFEITSIDSFEECVAAGNPVMESYPRQCRTSDGKHFVEEIEEPPPVVLETEKNIYSKGEWVTVTITNLINEGYDYGVEIFDPNGKPFFDCLVRAQSIPQINPNATTSESWELSKDCRDEPTLPGRYTVLFSSEFGHAVHSFTVR